MNIAEKLRVCESTNPRKVWDTAVGSWGDCDFVPLDSWLLNGWSTLVTSQKLTANHAGQSLLCIVLLSLLCLSASVYTSTAFWEFVAHSAHTFDVTPLYWAHPLLCQRLPFSPFRRTLSRGRWQYWPWSSFFRHSVLRAIPTSLRHGAGRATWSLRDWVWHTWVQIPFPRLAKFVSLVKAVNFSGPLFPHL